METILYNSLCSASLHEWITAIHANIQPYYSVDSNYSTVNDIEINPDFTLYNGEDSKDSSPTANSPKHLKQRRRSSSAADKFKSIFKYKKNKRGKDKLDILKASSDTELPVNPSPPNLDALYSKINRNTKLRKAAHAIMVTRSPLDLGADYIPEQQFDDRPQACHSEPTNLINNVDVGLRGKTKRLRTRSERGCGRRSHPEVSSSDEEINDNTSPRKSSIKENEDKYTEASEDKTSPMFLFPPPPSHSPSDLSELQSPKIFKLPNKLSSPTPKKKTNKYTKQSPIVHDAQFEFQTSIDNSVLLPEHEITILKLKTNSSSDSATEEVPSPPTREIATLVHPKKRLSVGSPPVSAKDLDVSFLFPEKDTLTNSLPIRSVMDTQIHSQQTAPRVVTKVVSEVGKSKQPYVNLPQLIKSSERNGLPVNGGKPKLIEKLNSFSSDNTQRAMFEKFAQTDSPPSLQLISNLTQGMDIDELVPPRPAKPPKQLPQRPQPFKKSTLKSNLKQPQLYNSVSSTASSNALSKDSQEVESISSVRPKGLKVNFGGTTEIPVTPNTNSKKMVDNSYNYSYGQPNNSNYHQGFNSFLEFSMPYGNFPPQHAHFASDPHFRQVMVPTPIYYPSSLHVPSMSMLPNAYDSLIHDSFQEDLISYPQVKPTYSTDRHDQYPAAFGYNSSIPYYMSPPPFASYSTDPNIKELRSSAYSAYSGECYQSHSFKTNALKPSRPAPAPPRNPPNTKLRMLQESKRVAIIPNANRATTQTETMV